MDRDFHFGATYYAAVTAGFAPEKALIIARAAQYVDQFDSSAHGKVQEALPEGKKAAQTVQGSGALLVHDLANWCGVDAYTAHIWPVFHFLPGNYGRADVIGHSATDSAVAPLICRPYGPLAKTLLDETKRLWEKHADTPKEERALIRIGITMHVLADTFAHANFVGLPSENINEVTNITDERNERKKLTIYPLKDYSPTFFSSGYGYLGHGRIGHLPDQAWQHYAYKNAWAGDFINRDNPAIYTEALVYLMEVLQYILGKPNSAIPNSSNEIPVTAEGIASTKAFFGRDADGVDAQETRWAQLNGGAAYQTPTFEDDKDFMLIFGRQAWKHKDLVLTSCAPLESVLTSSRITK